ncbi:DgyrCDS39 [Dimorphilus gyrociliatus]|uniref:DgyrCDS39 n=1 Tax=Dimorphilus gyrociliatus TaxID=2664684 RepID=A0A7I8V3F7_9ANNE|nr:DgyrCDS39 [Dimorphilus gyrociliatus]
MVSDAFEKRHIGAAFGAGFKPSGKRQAPMDLGNWRYADETELPGKRHLGATLNSWISDKRHIGASLNHFSPLLNNKRLYGLRLNGFGKSNGKK